MFTTTQSRSLFPIYLLPSLPFRRRRRRCQSPTPPPPPSSSPDDTIIPGSGGGGATNTTPTSTTSKMMKSGNTQAEDDPYLSGHTSRLRCASCAADLCLSSQIISKGFTGRLGRAYLISPSPSPSYSSSSSSSASASSSSSSSSSSSPSSQQSLPNTYTSPAVPRQLVTGLHTVSDVSCSFCATLLGWKYEGAEEEGQRYKVGKFILETRRIRAESCWEGAGWMMGEGEAGGGERVEFDSGDEDECEDLFGGVWSEALVRRRREGRPVRR